ncbi:hypothetical protein ABZV58_09810 [Nocardia sp. NPDC004654]|uniref:hypothetical protein n=1 Tax=Nocardia sp. NPDC004654 TaxID=3154776 RepID=UPI0033BD6A63
MTVPLRAPMSLLDLPGPDGWPVLGNLPQLTPTRLHRHSTAGARNTAPSTG